MGHTYRQPPFFVSCTHLSSTPFLFFSDAPTSSRVSLRTLVQWPKSSVWSSSRRRRCLHDDFRTKKYDIRCAFLFIFIPLLSGRNEDRWIEEYFFLLFLCVVLLLNRWECTYRFYVVYIFFFFFKRVRFSARETWLVGRVTCISLRCKRKLSSFAWRCTFTTSS